MNRPHILTKQVITTLSVFFVFAALPAHAHKLNVFSWAGDKQIYGEAFFNGGRKAKNITIQVQDAKSDALILTTQTDKEGKFQFSPPQQALQQKLDLRIIANSGDGHRGEWLLTADEYLVPDSPPLAPAVEKSQAGEKVEIQTIRQIIRQELARELTPIKQQLAEGHENKARSRDIIGGIGWIIGLAGLLAWIQSNKKKKKSADE
jgi:nickel transport protein